MSKAVYIMDMPMCCDDCVFLDGSGDYPYCKATGQTKGYTFRVRENKMDKCPLREMPEKMDCTDMLMVLINVLMKLMESK